MSGDAWRGPLHGVRVLELGGLGPIARCSSMLRDLGADVTKIFRLVSEPGKEAPFFAYRALRRVRSLQLDVRDERARSLLYRLLPGTDVVLEGFRPGTAARLGLDHDTMRAHNDHLIYCSLSGYGQEGPYSQWAGHDLNYAGMSGILTTSRLQSDGTPAIPGLTVADSAGGGLYGVIAVLAALVERSVTGAGAYLDVSATDGVVDLMSMQIDEFLATGAEPFDGSGQTLGAYACYDTYECADGAWVSVAAIEPKFFRNLCERVGCPEVADDQYRLPEQDRLRALLAERFRSRTRDAWVAELAPFDTCVAPIYRVSEVPTDPHLQSRGRFLTVSHPDHGHFQQVAAALGGDDVADLEVGAAGDVRAYLAAAGLTDAEVADLVAEHVLNFRTATELR